VIPIIADSVPVDKPKGQAIDRPHGRPGRTAFAWAMKRGTVQSNRFADLPEHEGDARRAIEDGRAKASLALPGMLGTPFAGWSKAKAALDKAIADARAKAAADAGTSAAPLAPWSVHDLRRTVATGLQRLGVRGDGRRVEPHQRQPRRDCRGVPAPRLGERKTRGA
jgi:hypothetical protein